MRLTDGGKTDFIEAIYAELERRVWASFDNIRDSTAEKPIDVLDKMNLFHFLSHLHWRLPSNSRHLPRLSDSLFSEKSVLPYMKLVDMNNKDAPETVASQLKSQPDFDKAVRVMAAFAPFYQRNWTNQLKNWRFLYSGDDQNWFLVGDNPIVTDGRWDHDPKECLRELFFPVSSRILLVSTKRNISPILAPDFVIQFNTSILMRSSRFVAFQRRDFLEAIVRDYQIHKRLGKENSIINRLFEMLDEGKV
jgi:hypothetical protein